MLKEENVEMLNNNEVIQAVFRLNKFQSVEEQYDPVRTGREQSEPDHIVP